MIYIDRACNRGILMINRFSATDLPAAGKFTNISRWLIELVLEI